MIIRGMRADFGVLRGAELRPGEGLTVIEGANESGKSTWCAFIRAMLYGISSTERDTKTSLADKNRYRSWQGGEMSGSMKLSSVLGEITIERRGSSTAPFRELKVYRADGTPLIIGESELAQRLLGVGKDVFEKSAFIVNPEIGGGGGEIEKRILSLVSSGSEEVSVSEAESRLKAWQRGLRFNKTGSLPKLEEEAAGLKAALELISDKAEALERVREKAESAAREVARLEAELEAHTALAAAETAKKRAAALSALEKAEIEIAAAKTLIPKGSSPDELRKLLSALDTLKSIERYIAGRRARTAEHRQKAEELQNLAKRAAPFFGCTAEDAMMMAERDAAAAAALSLPPDKDGLLWIILIAAALLGAAAMLLKPILALLPIAAGIMLAAIRMARRKAEFKTRLGKLKQLQDKYAALTHDDIKSVAAAYRELLKRRDDALEAVGAEERENAGLARDDGTRARLSVLFGRLEDSETAARIAEALSAYARLSSAEGDKRAAQATLDALPEAPALDEGLAPVVTMSREDAENGLTAAKKRLGLLREEAAGIEGSIGGAGVPAEIERKLNALDERKAELEKHYAAISLALNALKQTDEALRERFSPPLNAAASAIFAELTGARYGKVLVSKELEAKAEEASVIGLRRALELSRGTADQLWLSVRLALCDMILPKETNPPLVLDDALITYDKERLGRALDYLLRLSKTRQILLFSCHDREARALEGCPGVTHIRL